LIQRIVIAMAAIQKIVILMAAKWPEDLLSQRAKSRSSARFARIRMTILWINEE